jgi:EipB-like
MHSFSRAVLLASLGVVAALPAWAQAAKPAAQMPFIPHRAVYDLSLGKSERAGGPSSVRGRIVYEFSGSACEGYVTNFRQLTDIQMDEGARTSDMRSSTFEEGDGSGFRFKTDNYIDGRLVESVDGRASRAKDGALSVALSKPTPAKSDFAPGPIFPTAQMFFMLEAAKKGERTAEVPVYDGGDGGMKLYDTTSIIGNEAKSAPSESTLANAPEMKGVRRWPVSVSYFEKSKADGEPNYTLSFDLYENGVSGALKINYGNYSLNGTLSKFEVLPQKGGC